MTNYPSDIAALNRARTRPEGVNAGPGGRPMAARALAQQVNKPLPWIVPIPGAIEFNTLQQVATSAIGTLTPANVAVTVPDGFVARIASLLIGITDSVAATDVTYDFRVNQGPIPGYNGLRMFYGVASRLVNTFEPYLIVEGPAVVDLQIKNNDGGTYQVGGGIGGWFWSRELGERWQQSNGGE